MNTNETKLTREEAIAYVLRVEKQINDKVATQYLGMPREELKEIIFTVVRKTTELRIFCHEHDLDFHQLTGR